MGCFFETAILTAYWVGSLRQSGGETIRGWFRTVKAFFAHRSEFHDSLLQVRDLFRRKSWLALLGLETQDEVL